MSAPVPECIPMNAMIATGIFSTLGVIILFITTGLFDLLTPGKLWHEIVAEKNLPLAIVTGAVIVGISQIIAASVHG
jgi:putative membrane protein